MCHVYGTTIDVDRFFQQKWNAKRGSEKYLARKKRLDGLAQVYKWYTCYGCIHSLLNNVFLGYWIPDWLV